MLLTRLSPLNLLWMGSHTCTNPPPPPPHPIPPPFQCWDITKSSDIQQGYRERDQGRCWSNQHLSSDHDRSFVAKYFLPGISSSLRGSYLNLSKELKTCEKTYTRIQHTPHPNVLHSLLRFHRILFMKSRNEIPAWENGLTGTTILLSLVTCAPFLMVAGLAPCAPFVTTTGLVACAPFLTFVTVIGLLGR